MLRGDENGKKVLLQYLQDLRTTADPGPLRPRLAKVIKQMDKDLNTHIRNLRSQVRIASYQDY